jgi:formiminoglutamase
MLYSHGVSIIPHCSKPKYPKNLTSARMASLIETADPRGCAVALLGLADDLGVSMNGGRPGAREGPRAFREALSRYGVARPIGWDWPKVFDAGDIVPGMGTGVGALTRTHDRVTQAVKAILDLGMFPIGIGGGHDLTFPFVRGVIEWHETNTGRKAPRRERFSGVYFDAHLDVRDTPGSGMPFRELVEECGVESLCVHGLNPFANSREHVEWFLDNGGTFGDEDSMHLPGRGSAFVSFDLDVLDAAFAPGVSALNPAGWSVGMAEAWMGVLGADQRVKCFDIMELCPAHDVGDRTARVAAHLFLSFLHGFSQRSSTPAATKARRGGSR